MKIRGEWGYFTIINKLIFGQFFCNIKGYWLYDENMVYICVIGYYGQYYVPTLLCSMFIRLIGVENKTTEKNTKKINTVHTIYTLYMVYVYICVWLLFALYVYLFYYGMERMICFYISITLLLCYWLYSMFYYLGYGLLIVGYGLWGNYYWMRSIIERMYFGFVLMVYGLYRVSKYLYISL